MRVDPAGRIWFVTSSPQNLGSLVPADGCIIKQIWLGGAVNALFIRPDDPHRDEKYALLLSAFTTGTTVRFGPVKDNATGWCSVNDLTLG